MYNIISKHYLISAILLLVTSLIGNANESVERLFWDKVPLRITLPVGKERLVIFPDSVRLKIPAQLSAKLRTQSNEGTVYWLASEKFETQRIEVREIKNNQIYLIDLKATKSTPSLTQSIEVLVKEDERRAEEKKQGSRKSKRKIGYAALTRFAGLQLYAPGRLLQSLPGTHRVPVERKMTTYLMMGQMIDAMPIASWKSGRLYVTAVEIRNASGKKITLDARVIRGKWLAATFHDDILYPAGSDEDSTAVYLISDRPFHEARAI